ncbi:MAG: DEAD/DEAH box helicase [Aquificaceae bacterium]|nr:DEAD/DEAH box helicase [Aquificaceae bacterium]MCX8059975.1 DEAD/DEAH box helicase [Aquificaceae bacterium]MDW8097336.1 DEAD/DEAH box helicase [Aquificaceae bacterium]
MDFSFSQLSLPLQRALRDMGFEKPTPIQKEAIPLALKGYDLLGQAATGTGKTAAFGIPIVEGSDKGEGTTALIMTPTRELALQVKEQLYLLSKYKGLKVYSFYGGTSVQRDLELLWKTTPNVVVGTPGRMKDLMMRGLFNFDNLRYFVLDEADRMLDMGFIEDIEWIISQLPKNRQNLFFSATIDEKVEELAKRHLRKDYKFVKVITEELKPKIEERLIRLSSSGQKLSELEKILKDHLLEKVIVFVKTKKDAKDIAEELKRRGFNVVSLHGDMTQRQRENSLRLFREGKVRIVVATDVASRGLDIKGVSLVVNYHIPEDPEVYIHRIGRTGRIGNYGKAYSLVSPEDTKALWRIKKLKEQNAKA